MSDRTFEGAVNDWLEDGSDRTPRSAIDAVLLAVKTTPQERDLRIPWRFPFMPALSRASGLAAVALVAVVGAGALIYLNSTGPGGAGSQPTSSPTTAPTPAATVAPTAAPTSQPTFDPTGPSAWTTYTSAVYGYTIAYPSDWSVHSRAEHKWQPGEPAIDDGWPWADVFANPEAVDGDSMGLWVWQVPAPAGADLDTWEGLRDVLQETCDEPSMATCPGDDPPITLCLGEQDCRAAIIVLWNEELTPVAAYGDPEAGVVNVFAIGRPDDFPAAARYGGSVALLKAILSQVDVREPQPGETPH